MTSQWLASWSFTGRSRFSHMKAWEQTNVCTICTAQVPANLYSDHWARHLNMRQCAECDVMVFAPKWEQHERIHIQQRHQCPRCKQCFASSDSLRKHMRRMHSGIKATCVCGTVVHETDMHYHMTICPAHDLRLAHFWDMFRVVDEDTGELFEPPTVIRPFTEREYATFAT